MLLSETAVVLLLLWASVAKSGGVWRREEKKEEEDKKKREQLAFEDLWLKWLPGMTCLRFLCRMPFLKQLLHCFGNKWKTCPLEAVLLMSRSCGTNPQCVHCHAGLNRSHPDWNNHAYCISHLHPGECRHSDSFSLLLIFTLTRMSSSVWVVGWVGWVAAGRFSACVCVHVHMCVSASSSSSPQVPAALLSAHELPTRHEHERQWKVCKWAYAGGLFHTHTHKTTALAPGCGDGVERNKLWWGGKLGVHRSFPLTTNMWFRNTYCRFEQTFLGTLPTSVKVWFDFVFPAHTGSTHSFIFWVYFYSSDVLIVRKLLLCNRWHRSNSQPLICFTLWPVS